MKMLYLSFMTLVSMLISSKRMPGRDWQTEFHARLFKRFFLAANQYGPQWSRKVLESVTSKSSVTQRINVEEIKLAHVPTQKITPQSVNSEVLRIIVFMHGGGYLTGSAKAYLAFVARLADQSNLLTYSVDYRLSPEHPFPIPQEDCYTAIHEIAKLHPEHQLVLMGDSAGGGLCISACLHGDDALRSRIAGLGLISPWVDPSSTSGTMESNLSNDMFTLDILADSFAQHMKGADPMDTRVNFTQAPLDRLPPVHIQVASGEVFFDQIIEFAERTKAGGIPTTIEVFDAQFHVFQTIAHHFEDAKRARASLVTFARSGPTAVVN
jgi:monoterpene epsilon-lactone hydrolase